MCITHEEYIALYDLVAKVDGRMDNLENKVEEIQDDSKETRKLVTGNGEPEHGIAWKLSFLQRILNDHLAFHKGVENKLWDTARPILSKILEWLILSGIVYTITENVIHSSH